MGDEVNNIFSQRQKDKIYREMLVPLKLRISQILLYDTEAALEFLKEYNEIVKNEEIIGNQIIEHIVKLETKIQKYMSEKGKDKAFNERSKAILQCIEDLKINSIQLSLEQFGNEFTKLKADYEGNVENYNFEDRDKIEREIYALQASFIMRQVASGITAYELQQTISEQDKIGLNMFVIEKIDSLRQRTDLKEVATKINNIVVTDNDAVLNPQLWSWMDAADKGMKIEEQKQMIQPITSTAMIVAPKKNNIILKDSIFRLFSKEPQFPLQTSDLKKINIQWLSKYIPKSMLIELEEQRLRQEEKQVDCRFIPDSKVVIYEMLKERECEIIKEYNNEEKQYKFLKENGAKINVIIEEHKETDWFEGYRNDYTRVKMQIEGVNEESYSKVGYRSKHLRLNDALIYADLLDKIFNTDFQQQLLQEIKEKYIDRTSRKSPIYDNIISSFDDMYKEYQKTKLDFMSAEAEKRAQFYEKDKFKEKMKYQGIDDGNKKESKDVDKFIMQERDYNDKGVEQGGE